MIAFIVHFKDGSRKHYNIDRYDEDDEYEVDAAWDEVYAAFPDADYIERFQKISGKWVMVEIYHNSFFNLNKNNYDS